MNIGSSSSWVVETTSETFDRDVIQRSKQVPVVVDFWAPWCAPCRALAPVLVQLANEHAGKFVLVKANVDQMPDIAAGFGVQSIPAVYGFRDGHVVDGFVGALAEPELRGWVDRLLPSPAQQRVQQGMAVLSDNAVQAEARFREALELDPNLLSATAGLADALWRQQRFDECQSAIQQLDDRGYSDPEIERIKAELALRRQAEHAGNLAACRQAVAQRPNDAAARFALAQALVAQQQYAEALQTALHIVQIDRTGLGDSARQLMVDIFRVLSDDSPLTREYRRKLSMALY